MTFFTLFRRARISRLPGPPVLLSSCLLFLLLLPAFHSYSRGTLILGHITEEISNAPLPEVNIREKTSGKRSKSDVNGNFKILLTGEKIILRFTCVGYDTVWLPLELTADTLHISLQMKRSTLVYDPVTITAPKPDTVLGFQKFFINDFEFYGDRFILLTFERKPEKSKVMLANEGNKIISVFPLPINGIELFKDFLGNVNVVGKDSVYRVVVKGDEIKLLSLPPDDFENMIKPCIDTINGKIVFSDYRDDYPEFSYYTWNREDSTATKIQHVIDEDLAMMYSFEYDYLNPRQKVYVRKLEMSSGIDKREIAAYMTNFAHSRYFTPLYAPLFIVRDTMYLFEHYRSKLYKMNRDGQLLDSVSINYHKPEKWREWRRKLILEEKGERIYGLFLKDGYYRLKQINLQSGKVDCTSKLYYPYVGKIRVKNGYAYYIYRPFESLQTKYLYKEKLQEYKSD